ncbi:MAG TPA: hypothetical protein PLR50_11195, partial [Candidatus Rifleibacterium sp.]|nr:hypothetical protein [Candidatus Rifleibacterium sp.]
TLLRNSLLIAQSKLTSLRGFVIVAFLRTTAKSVRTTSIAQSHFPGNMVLKVGCIICAVRQL